MMAPFYGSFLLGVFTCFIFVCAKDLCIGSGCECTEYPIHITCKDGHPDILSTMVKRHALTLNIHGDSVTDLLMVKLTDFVSLKTLAIYIRDPDVCYWALANKRVFPKIYIETFDVCEEYLPMHEKKTNGPTSDNIDEQQTTLGSHTVDTGDTYIQIKSRDLFFIFILMAFVSLCGVLRPVLR